MKAYNKQMIGIDICLVVILLSVIMLMSSQIYSVYIIGGLIK